MKERLLSLIAGFGLSLGIILAAIYFFSKPKPIKTESVEPINPALLESFSNEAKSLTNYGELPKPVNAPEVGRTNPFDNY